MDIQLWELTWTGVPSCKTHSKLRLSAEPRRTRQVKTALCGSEFSSVLTLIGEIGANLGGTKINQTNSDGWILFWRRYQSISTNNVEVIFCSLPTTIIVIKNLAWITTIISFIDVVNNQCIPSSNKFRYSIRRYRKILNTIKPNILWRWHSCCFTYQCRCLFFNSTRWCTDYFWCCYRL